MRANGASSAHTACAWPLVGFSATALDCHCSRSHMARMSASSWSMSTTSRLEIASGLASMNRFPSAFCLLVGRFRRADYPTLAAIVAAIAARICRLAGRWELSWCSSLHRGVLCSGISPQRVQSTSRTKSDISGVPGGGSPGELFSLHERSEFLPLGAPRGPPTRTTHPDFIDH